MKSYFNNTIHLTCYKEHSSTPYVIIKANDIAADDLFDLIHKTFMRITAGTAVNSVRTVGGVISFTVGLGRFGYVDISIDSMEALVEFIQTVGSQVYIYAMIGDVYKELIIPTMEKGD